MYVLHVACGLCQADGLVQRLDRLARILGLHMGLGHAKQQLPERPSARKRPVLGAERPDSARKTIENHGKPLKMIKKQLKIMKKHPTVGFLEPLKGSLRPPRAPSLVAEAFRDLPGLVHRLDRLPSIYNAHFPFNCMARIDIHICHAGYIIYSLVYIYIY